MTSKVFPSTDLINSLLMKLSPTCQHLRTDSEAHERAVASRVDLQTSGLVVLQLGSLDLYTKTRHDVILLIGVSEKAKCE